MTTKHYFLDGNTSKGYVSLIQYVIDGINKIYVVKGSLSSEKTKLFKKISKHFEQKGYLVQWLHNPSDEENLDGVIIPQKGIAVIDGRARNGIEAKYANFIEQVFDLDESLNKATVVKNKNLIIQLQSEVEKLHQEAYARFANGVEIHKKKEELYISAMDFDKANKVTAQLAANLFHDVSIDGEKPIVKQLFFGAATPKGAINYIDNITNEINKRYIIKGRSGSGKSTVMRKIAKYGENLGLTVQYFPCGLDPHSLDMIIIPSLSVAILDGTAPHVIDPTRKSDEVIDMFELCMDQSVDSKYDQQFDELQLQYKQQMKEGTELLQKALETKNKLEQYYKEAVDTDLLNQKGKEIVSAITN